jgi:hypothetical protein
LDGTCQGTILRGVVSPFADKHQLTVSWIEMCVGHEGGIEPGNAFEQQALGTRNGGPTRLGYSVLIPIYNMTNNRNEPGAREKSGILFL